MASCNLSVGVTKNSSDGEGPSNSKSNRQKFRELPVNPAVLSYIRKIGVGIAPRSRKRASGSRRSTSRSPVEQPYTQTQRRPTASGTTTTSTLDAATKVSNVSPPAPFGPKSRVRVIASCKESSHFPHNPHETPEVAVAGRSNVGKSTLLNALLYGNKYQNRPGLSKGTKAAVSSRPGETREITFYQISSYSQMPSAAAGGQQERAAPAPKLRLVDLPGYGFAYATEDHLTSFQNLMKEYILHRGKVLKRVLLLLDARHGLKKTDRDFLRLLQEGGVLPPIQLVLTKSDLVTQNDLVRRAYQVKQELSDCLRREPSQLPVMLVSAQTSLMIANHGGLLELQKELAALVPDR